jgi:hypothetical protein
MISEPERGGRGRFSFFAFSSSSVTGFLVSCCSFTHSVVSLPPLSSRLFVCNRRSSSPVPHFPSTLFDAFSLRANLSPIEGRESKERRWLGECLLDAVGYRGGRNGRGGKER